MSVREIVEYAKGRLPTKSKTPDTVVARDLSMDIKRKGETSSFTRTAPGRYTMRCYLEAATERSGDGDGTTSVIASAIKRERAGTLPAPASQPAQSGQTGATSSSR
jgi:hypothetical protein